MARQCNTCRRRLHPFYARRAASVPSAGRVDRGSCAAAGRNLPAAGTGVNRALAITLEFVVYSLPNAHTPAPRAPSGFTLGVAAELPGGPVDEPIPALSCRAPVARSRELRPHRNPHRTATAVTEKPVPSLPALRATPNPFGAETTVSYSLQHPGTIELRVYDVAGRLVATLDRGPRAAGPHQAVWNGRNSRGQVVASGVYFVQLRTERDTFRSKVVLSR